MDNIINACSACVSRHGCDNVNALNDCCYNTCAQFVPGTIDDVVHSQCGQTCRLCTQKAVFESRGKNNCQLNIKVPIIKPAMQNFKGCLNTTPDTKEALRCCLGQCKGVDCQERCIDAYNSLIHVREDLILGFRVNKAILTLISTILFSVSVELGYITLPHDQFKSIAFIVGVYVMMYYGIYHVI